MRVVILGAGFGGLELSSRISEELGDDAEVVLIDKTDSFVFGFSKLDVMFGRKSANSVKHSYLDAVKPGVEFVQAEITTIDPAAKRAETTAGGFEGDVLVVALGADLDPAATPGFAEGALDFYTEDSALGAREVLERFKGGRVVVGVVSAPFKCPPAPSEAALLMDEHLTKRGLRERSEIALVMPFGRPIPPSPEASAALLDAFTGRGIEWCPERRISEIDPSRATVSFTDGDEMVYDLFLGVPHHRAPQVVVESGMTAEGWVTVDPLTLETAHPGVYAIGDVANVGTPRAGVFAEGQAKVVADRIVALARGDSSDATYGGRGICYLEFGDDEVALVDVTFFGDIKRGELRGPSAEFAAEKAEFGSSRIKRWFGRDWRGSSS